MPAKSKAQYKLMRAVLARKSNAAPQKVAAEYVAATKAPGKLPAKVKR